MSGKLINGKYRSAFSFTNFDLAHHEGEEFCYGVSEVPERYLKVPKVSFNLSR
jgi:hypothetical protein